MTVFEFRLTAPWWLSSGGKIGEEQTPSTSQNRIEQDSFSFPCEGVSNWGITFLGME
jgi:hypothetical protein